MREVTGTIFTRSSKRTVPFGLRVSNKSTQNIGTIPRRSHPMAIRYTLHPIGFIPALGEPISFMQSERGIPGQHQNRSQLLIPRTMQRRVHLWVRMDGSIFPRTATGISIFGARNG